MRESQLVSSVKREGMVEGEIRARRADVLEALQVRLTRPVPEALRLAVEGTNDPEILKRWHRLALTVGSMQEFGAAIATP